MSPEPSSHGVWWEVSAEHRAPAEQDVLAEILRERAQAGVVLAAAGVIAYFADQETARKAAAAVAHLAGRVLCLEVQEAGWSGWQRAFCPVAAGERLRVIPSWLAPAPQSLALIDSHSAELPVIIEPGAAFGTGDHPTTAACLGYLSRMVWSGCRVLDAGTGSGVLAIAAALLGAGRVWALDLDPVACRAARANVKRNPGAQGLVEVRRQNVARLDGVTADIIVANLSTDLHLILASRYGDFLAAGGAVIASGIGTERAGEVVDAVARAGLIVRGRTLERGWTTLVLRRAGAAG